MINQHYVFENLKGKFPGWSLLGMITGLLTMRGYGRKRSTNPPMKQVRNEKTTLLIVILSPRQNVNVVFSRPIRAHNRECQYLSTHNQRHQRLQNGELLS
jgi:hypothetical protein